MPPKTRCPECGSLMKPVRGVPRCPECDGDADHDAPPRKARRPRRKRPAATGRSRTLVMVGLAGAGALAVVAAVVVGLVLFWGKGGGQAGGGPPGGGLLGGLLGTTTVIDAPLPGIDAIKEDVPPFRLAAAVPPAVVAAPPAVDRPARWNVPADAPPEPPPPLAADLDIPVEPTHANGFTLNPPVLADLGGPFLVPPTRWKEYPYSTVFDDKLRAYVVRGKPQPNTPVYDLRTGKPVGEFSWRANVAKQGTRLSPDGQWLFTMDPEKNRTNEEGKLYLWKRGKDEPTILQSPGKIGWIGWLGPARLAAITFEPDPTFTRWDVATGKVEVSAKLPPDRTAFAGLNNQFKFQFWPDYHRAAASPTGRYLAVSGKDGVTLLTTADGKEVGFLPTAADAPNAIFAGLSFSPDGTRLIGVIAEPHAEVRVATEPAVRSWPRRPPVVKLAPQGGGKSSKLKEWDAATGRLLTDRALLPSNRQAFPGETLGDLLPGPAPGTLLQGTGLVPGATADGPLYGLLYDTLAGSTVDKVEFDPRRVAGPGRLLGLVKAGDKKLAVRTCAYDAAVLAKRAGAAVAGVAARPAVRPLDRAGARVGPPAPPPAWAAPPAGTEVETPTATASTPTFPEAFSDAAAADLRQVFVERPNGRFELHWHPLDAATGKPAGDPVRLYPWMLPPDLRLIALNALDVPLAALAADGKRLATVDPADWTRVDVWAAGGGHVGAVVPTGRPIDWLGWSAGGKVVALSGGKVIGWDAATGKAAYEIDGGYPGPIDLAPARKWLAVARANAIDLLDADSGACLTRCLPKTPGGGCLALAVALDGKWLAAARRLAEPEKKRHPGEAPLPPTPKFLVDVWDLATGMPTEVACGLSTLEFLQWRSSRLLQVGTAEPAGSGDVEVIDPLAGVVAVLGAPPKDDKRPRRGTGPLAASPDGRVWLGYSKPGANGVATEQWVGMPALAADSPLLVPDRVYLDVKAQAMRVEVDIGDGAASRKVAERLAGDLQRGGFTIGPKHWTLRLTHTVENSGRQLAGRFGEAIEIPRVRFEYKLTDETGAELWAATRIGLFAYSKSRYYAGSTDDKDRPRGRHGEESATFYAFPGDIKAAVVREILERWADAPDVALPPGGRAVRTRAVTALLPLRPPLPLYLE